MDVGKFWPRGSEYSSSSFCRPSKNLQVAFQQVLELDAVKSLPVFSNVAFDEKRRIISVAD